MKKKQFPVGFYPYQMERLKEISKETGFPISELIRRAVDKDLKIKAPKIGE